MTPAEAEELRIAQHRYTAALPLVLPAAHFPIVRYVEMLERDLLASYERWCRIHERELSSTSVLRKTVGRPSTVGYLEVAHLRYPGEIRDALRDLLARGARSLILDLRDAPGGSIEQTVKVASEFIASGPVMQVAENGERRVYEAIGNGVAMDPTIRVVALVSPFTSSAAEALLAALRHHGRATLVGETSFGKTWLWQRRADGTEVKTGEWYSPSGELMRRGVSPDIRVDDVRDGEDDAILERAYAVLAGAV